MLLYFPQYFFIPFLDTLPVFADDLQTKPSAPHSTKTKLAVNDRWNESKDKKLSAPKKITESWNPFLWQ